MNIFARELAKVLAKHGRELSSLFTLKSPETSIHPNKVARLKRSLTGEITATLNAEELEMLQQEVPFDEKGEEMRILRAALLAEAIHRLLAGRLAAETAFQVGEFTFLLLMSTDNEEMEHKRDYVLENVRHSFSHGNMSGNEILERLAPLQNSRDLLELRIEQALEHASEAFEQGILWQEIAKDTTEREARLGYKALATSYVERAYDLADNVASFAQRSDQQKELLVMITQALHELEECD